MKKLDKLVGLFIDIEKYLQKLFFDFRISKVMIWYLRKIYAFSSHLNSLWLVLKYLNLNQWWSKNLKSSFISYAFLSLNLFQAFHFNNPLILKLYIISHHSNSKKKLYTCYYTNQCYELSKVFIVILNSFIFFQDSNQNWQSL